MPCPTLSYYVLRHPVKQKIYLDDADRDWRDGVTFEELQIMAHKAVVPDNYENFQGSSQSDSDAVVSLRV